MLKEVIKYLNPEQGELILDCTVGLGGHTEEILRNICPGGRLIGIDQDAEVLTIAEERLRNFNSSYRLVHDNFQNLDKILNDLKIERIDGALFDLGVSSFQLDTPERGFSIRFNAPLDMRMDRGGHISAFDLVNNLSQEEIARLLISFGQERWTGRIAKAIVRERRRAPITTTKQLVEIIMRTIPYKATQMRIHPATRTFQALRIAVNRELESLEQALEKVIPYLNPMARICVISFHSLEDRIVKNQFRKFAKSGALRILTPKPLTPGREEVSINPRSRSAKFRVAERI